MPRIRAHRCSMWPLAVMAFAAASLVSCGDPAPAGPKPIVIPAANEPVMFSTHVEPIIQTSCGGADCHLAGEDGGGYRMDSWEQMMAGAAGETEVIPFASRRSHLFQHLNSDTTAGPIAEPRMPLSRDPLPPEQIATIVRWIDEGARDDRGTVALAEAGRRRVFLNSRSESLIAVIDQATGLVARYLDASTPGGIPDEPAECVASADGFLYVALRGTSRVLRYDARTLVRTGELRLADVPAQMVVSPDGARLYVAHHGQRETQHVSVVDTRSMSLAGTIDSIGRSPRGLVMSADGRWLYTMNIAGDDVGIVDVAQGRPIARVPVSYRNPLVPGFIARYEPYAAVLGDDDRTLWVTCRRSGEVRAIDLVSRSVVDSIFVGARPLLPAMAPDGRSIWVPNSATNSVTVIDPARGVAVATVRDMANGPNAIVFAPDGRTAYVVCESLADGGRHAGAGVPGAVCFVDVASRQLLRTVEVASGASGVAMSR